MAHLALRLPVPETTWIPRDAQADVVEFLHNSGLIKIDNGRQLPLKSGGKTDIYINLRNMRSNPRAASQIADLFAYPLRWLNPDRFVEVPEAVSGLAGHLSVILEKPYVSIRGEVKEGRATDARMVGECTAGERVAIIDDVVTNGASKLVPHNFCTQDKKLLVDAFVVLVDRQQGWSDDFRKLGITTPVWAGMTLHDVRRELIFLNIMKRCDEKAESANPIIIALDDCSYLEDLLPILEPLRTAGCILKVNDLAVNEGVARLMPELSVYGRVMVDLKFHDIPNTVKNACKHLAGFGALPWAVTVHASGGGKMIKAAKEALNYPTKVLGITVLTSIDKKTGQEVYHRLPRTQVLDLAKIAAENGADGLVCSPEEVKMLRAKFPNAILVTPGIRSEGQDAGDQKRTGTPAQAIKDGSTHIVMGRQITGSEDPAKEVMRVLTEELHISHFLGDEQQAMHFE